ncbi:MAG TPA: phosphoribosylformylglycinamidine synthase subunit PurS [Acidimicrobiales bacterium]|nr:phosphoribosylformylglycinamidine synthase subunit PurS [Acidimicrobiales bacterium]
MKYEVLVEVRLRPGIADPQGATIERALPALGFDTVEAVRVGKAFRLRVDAADEESARRRVVEMADRLLANPVIEESAIRAMTPVSPGDGTSAAREDADFPKPAAR